MRLNKPQAQTFEMWRRFRISPPRNADYFRAAWPRYVLFVIVLLPLAALGFAMGNPWVSAFVAGAFFGVVRNERIRLSPLSPILARARSRPRLEQNRPIAGRTHQSAQSAETQAARCEDLSRAAIVTTFNGRHQCRHSGHGENLGRLQSRQFPPVTAQRFAPPENSTAKP